MDFQQHMQWGTQHHNHQSDHPLKQQLQQQLPLDTKHDQQSPYAIPLFLTEPPVSKGGNMSDSHMASSTSKFPKMMMSRGGQGQQLQLQQFSSAQWQELELQAVIFRYMLAGASVPAELLQPIKNSLLNSSFFLHHFPFYQASASTICSSLQSGYWSRAGMDPEPGRCKRTDGKKWRCSRDVALGHKYCERHMNRGRNRSRKPVEIPKPRTVLNPSPVDCANAGGGELRKTAHPFMGSSKVHYSSFGGRQPSIDHMLHLNQRSSDMSAASKSPFELSHGAGSDGRVLRPFFDDWSRSQAEPGSEGINASNSLSMSIQGNSASDVSLKLSTGSENEESNAERDRIQLNWMTQWGQHGAGPMGGPLAEALRSSSASHG